MGRAAVLLALAPATILVLGTQIAMVSGLVVSCANFAFPVGLIGMLVGVSLLFILRTEAD
jgi:hypothetical protein